MWSRIATISRRSSVGLCKPQISRPKACLFHLSLSAHGKKGSGEDASKFSSTLNLPATTFPMRADAALREPQLFKDVYRWQFNNNPGPVFVSHDGPPYANGKPHVGHALNKILKDIVNRYKMMKGFKVSYIPGWDCHGLPIELKAMEALKEKAKGMNPIEIRSIATKYALEQIEVQKKEFKRWGVLGDWDNGYKTMEPKYEARQIGIFARMVKRGLIYRGLRPVYWSPSSRTALADAELEWMDHHVSPSIYVAFPVKSLPEKLKHWEKYSNLHATIWTTTPWTIPANMAISVNDAFEYSVVKYGDKHLLVARKRIEDLEKEFKSPLTSIDTVLGDSLVGMVCSHPIFGRDSPVLAGSHVTLESGTGLVHTAPGHGREDWLVCKPFNIPVLCPVNDDGVFTKEAGPQFEGKEIFKDGNRLVIEELQNRNVLLKREDYTHRYPYDWRTKKPVIWRATKQWFTDLTHIKDTAIEEVNNVQLVPPSGRARLSAMLKTRDDWCISRQRHWGVPIPVFYDVESDEHLMNDETIEFIQELIRQHGTNCWWTMSTEDLLPPNYRNNGRKYRKGTDTMDVWFDSGCSWASVLTDVYKKGDSLKDEEAVLNDIVADIYLEGSDQHRGWFQSSLLTSVAVRDKAPFKTIVTHGFTLDEHGRKMSKSLGNVIEPSQVIEGGNDKKKNPAYGVDVLRFWVSSTDYSNDVTISETLLEATSSNLKKLRNTCRFLLGNLNDFSAKDELPYDQLSSVDKYMLHRLTQFAQSIDQSYEAFNFSQVYKELTQFATGDLSSFYFEISKDKLYTMSKKSQHRRSCQTVLLKILDTLSKAMAPILCHTAEDIFQHSPILQQIKKQGTESIHAQGWFDLAPEWNNTDLEVQWLALKELKSNVNKILEHARQNEEKSHIHTALDASVKIKLKANSPLHKAINSVGEHLNEVFVVSGTTVEVTDNLKAQGEFSIVVEDAFGNYVISIEKSTHHKCPRCWKRTSTDAEKLCLPCDTTVKDL